MGPPRITCGSRRNTLFFLPALVLFSLIVPKTMALPVKSLDKDVHWSPESAGDDGPITDDELGDALSLLGDFEGMEVG